MVGLVTGVGGGLGGGGGRQTGAAFGARGERDMAVRPGEAGTVQLTRGTG